MTHIIGRGRYRGETYPGTGQGSGGGGGKGSTFVFRPGGTDTGPIIFNTMRGCTNAANALGGAVTTILIDHSIVGAIAHVVNDGLGPYNFSGVQLVGKGTENILIFDEGVTFSAFPHSVDSLILTSDSHSPIYVAPVFGGAPWPVIWLNGAHTILSVNFVPFIVVPDGAIITLNLLSIGGLGTGSIQVDGAGQIDICAVASGVSTGSLTGTGTATVRRDSASFMGAQTIATLNDIPISDASRETYTPANNGDWSGTNPTSVANALDRIAAKIGPIP